MPNLPEFQGGIALLQALSSTDSTIVAHFCETTRAITALTKNLDYLQYSQEYTSLLVKSRELFPLVEEPGLPGGVHAFSNYTADVDLISSPADCLNGGADFVKQFYVTGELSPG